MKDWAEWHRPYEPGSHLSRRLAVVQDCIRGVLDAAPAGPNASVASGRVADPGLGDRIEVVEGDAGTTSAYEGAVPPRCPPTRPAPCAPPLPRWA